LLTSGFGFAGFQVGLGLGASYDLFASGGSSSAKSTGASRSSSNIDWGFSLPSIDIFSIDLLAEKASTTDVACQVAASSSDEASIVANAAGAMTLKSSSILMSDQFGGAGGGAFTDDVTKIERIQTICIYRTNDSMGVQRISITYQLVDGSTVTTDHGGAGGGEARLNFYDDEYITAGEGGGGNNPHYLQNPPKPGGQ